MLRDKITAHKLFTKTRLPSLYSDFRKLEQVNPDGYEANLIAWRSLFTEFITHSQFRNTFVIETEGLLEELTLAEFGKPMCVDVALEDLVKGGDLVPWTQWTTTDGLYNRHLVRPVLNWAVNRFVWDTSYKIKSKNGLKNDKLVSKVMLEKYVDALEKKLSTKRHELVFRRDQFRQFLQGLDIKIEVCSTHLTELDFEVLITFLHRDLRKIHIRENVIKFGDEVTNEDVGICEIKATVKTLEEKNKELQCKIDSISTKLKQSLTDKSNKELSLNLLKSKKIAEQSLNKQLVSLTQLESVLYKIDESSSNLQLLNALEKGSVLLKGLNAQFGGVDRVESIMDELEEEKYEADQIADQLNRLNTTVDDEEVEEEFAHILEQEEAKAREVEDVTKKLEKLEIAPSNEPSHNQEKSEEKTHAALHS
jgi:charged multivesicular body protein 7